MIGLANGSEHLTACDWLSKREQARAALHWFSKPKQKRAACDWLSKREQARVALHWFTANGSKHVLLVIGLAAREKTVLFVIGLVLSSF